MSKAKKKSGDMLEILRTGFALFIVTAVAALLLGGVNDITKDRIAELEAEATRAAMQRVLSSADTFTEVAPAGDDSTIAAVSEGTQDGKRIGWCVTSTPSGFGGPIKLMVGVSADLKVTGVVIIDHDETPGLGSYADDQLFLGQYDGQSGPFSVVKSTASAAGEIEAISGATVTSRAVTAGVQAALDCAAALS